MQISLNHSIKQKKHCNAGLRLFLLLFFLVQCPDGWYSSHGVCAKAFESAAGLTYAQAVASCAAMAADIGQPMNELDSQNIFFVISNNTNLTSSSYWIGNVIEVVQMSSKLSQRSFNTKIVFNSIY
jgi:hypothetical protein